MIVLAAALLLAQDAVTLEAPQGWTTKQDPSKTIQIYAPPGLTPPKDATVLVYPAVDANQPVDAWLDAMVQNLTNGKRQLAPVAKVDVGPFKAAVISQQTAQGWREHLALHAVRWGNRGQAVLYAASDPDLFKEHAPAVAAMLAKAKIPAAAAAAGVSVAGLNFPAGWTRQDGAAGLVVLTPPAHLGFGNPRVLIPPARKIEGSHATAHRDLLKELADQAKFSGMYADQLGATAGPFIRSTAHNTTDARTIVLWTAASAGQMQAVILNPAGGDEMITAMLPILATKTAAAGSRPEIVEAYRRPNMKKYVNLDGSFSFGKLQYERVALLSNGVADFVLCHSEGYDGAAEILTVDPGTLNGYYGRWEDKGKEIHIQRATNAKPEVWTREDGGLRFGDQVWKPFARVDGLKLKGRYSYKSDPGPGIQFDYWVEFGEDGTFACNDLLTWLAVSDFTGRPKPPAPAKGSYEIRNWTIWFKVDGKPVWSTDLQPFNDDLKDLGHLLLNTYSFKKQ